MHHFIIVCLIGFLLPTFLWSVIHCVISLVGYIPIVVAALCGGMCMYSGMAAVYSMWS